MICSSALAGCTSTLDDDEPQNPNDAPKEAMGMWWPTIDGVIEIPILSPITEWSDSHVTDINFDDGSGSKHPAKLRYKSVEEGMALAVEIYNLDETPEKIVVTFPDRELTTEITTESDAFLPKFEVDCTKVAFNCDASEGQKLIDIGDLLDNGLVRHLRLNKIASVHNLDNDDLVMEASAKRLFDDTTEVSYTITVVFAESTWTFEKTTNFDWVLPFLFPRSDISVTGIEVTQAIQTADMQIPLVEGKTSMARVYVDSGELTTANVEVTLTYCILIFCVEELTTTHVAVQNPDRTDIDESANFILPDNWVTFEGIDDPIPIGLIATVTPIYPTGSIDYVDPDTSNNYFVEVFELHQTYDLRIAMLPVMNSVSNAVQNRMDYWIDMTEAVLPVADVEVIYWGATSSSVTGTGDDLIDWTRTADTFVSALYLAFTGETAWDQMHAVRNSGGGVSDPMWIGDTDGDGIENEYLSSGVANPGRTGRVSYCGTSATSRELCTAHEITHNLGPVNWDGDGDGFDADGLDKDWGKHLFAGCPGGSTADQVWVNQNGGAETQSNILDLGWNPITPNPETNQNSLLPSGYPDYMSYCMVGSDATTGTPWNLPYTTNLTKWVSTYRYQELFDDLSDWYEDDARPNYYTSTSGSSDFGARQQQTVRYVRGVAPHDGSTPSLRHSWTVDGQVPAFAMERGDRLSNWDLSVVVKDNNGNVLDSAKYVTWFNVHESETDLQDDYFSFYFQDDGLIHSIELQDRSGSVIDSLYSTGSPVTRVMTLGTTAYTRENPVNLSWTQATSSSNREVLYQVEYSWGNGMWLPISGLTNSTNMAVDFGTYPGGTNDSMFRVRATNGFDTYYSDSTTFSIPNQAPVLTLETSGARFYDEGQFDEGLVTDNRVSITQGESFSIMPEITDADWTAINENGCTAVLKRAGETVWSDGNTINAQASQMNPKNRHLTWPNSLEHGPGVHDSVHCMYDDVADSLLPYHFPNKDLLPSEMTSGPYEFRMVYVDAGGSSVTKTVSFSIIVPNYLVGPDSNARTEDVLDEYRSNLQALEAPQLSDVLSRNELQYYVELERAARGDDDALSDVEIDDLQALYGISDSRAAELEVMICVPPGCDGSTG